MSACEPVRAALEAGDSLSPEALAHVAGCGDCADLRAGGPTVARHLLAERSRKSARDFDEAPTMLADLRANLERERGLRAYLRSRSTVLRSASVLIVFAAVGFLHTASLLRPDAGVYPPARLAIELSVLCALAFFSTTIAFRPLQRAPAGSGAGVAVLVAAVGLPFVVAFASPAHASHPASLAGAGDDFARRAGGCFLYGVLWSLPVVLLFALADRRPSRSSVLLAAGASTVTANLALWLHCPITHGAHIALGHGAIGLFFLAIGALLELVARRGSLRGVVG